MTTTSRLRLSIGLLGAALAVQTGLLAHMSYGPTNTYEPLRKSFAALPTSLRTESGGAAPSEWSFVPLPAEKEIRKKLPFVPVDLTFRHCRAADRNVEAACYIVHTENGEDRRHHPEICIRDVQGLPEDASGRHVVPIGDDRNVQRICFARTRSDITTIYYWHYTVLPEVQDGQSWLQVLYQTFSRTPPSVTVQVSTNVGRDQWPAIEKTLLVSLDRQLRNDHLPPRVKMGHDRLPIAIAGK
jgi:hypothetical protein